MPPYNVFAETISSPDSSKLVKRLGAFPLPVEVIRFGWHVVADRLIAIGAEPTLRVTGADQPFLTDQGNLILDCRFRVFPEADLLASQLDSMVGLVEHGLFLDLADMAVIGCGDKTELIGASATTA